MFAADHRGLKRKNQHEVRFSLGIRVTGGRVTGKQLQKIYDIADIYGKGSIQMISQHRIEIPFIKTKDIERIKKELVSSGLEIRA
jgi:dissimilatory sulfite reductase (desulfoviridin) alpha/beta subunit